MPFMEAQVQGVHFAESEEKHKEDQPRKRRLEGQEELIAESSDEHREPEGVGVEEAFQNFKILNYCY